MTIIAWKDGIIAADSQVSTGNLLRYEKKLHRVGNRVTAWAGPCDFGLAVQQWFSGVAIPAEYPACQSQAEYAVFFVACILDGKFHVRLFYQTPYPVVRPEPFGAIGSGAEFAMGAMAAGASAQEAAILCTEHLSTCGGIVHTESLV